MTSFLQRFTLSQRVPKYPLASQIGSKYVVANKLFIHFSQVLVGIDWKIALLYLTTQYMTQVRCSLIANIFFLVATYSQLSIISVVSASYPSPYWLNVPNDVWKCKSSGFSFMNFSTSYVWIFIWVVDIGQVHNIIYYVPRFFPSCLNLPIYLPTQLSSNKFAALKQTIERTCVIVIFSFFLTF